MLIKLGRSQKTFEPIVLDTTKVVNPHLQATGFTGMGKTHLLQELVTSFVESAADLGQPVRVHVMDPHGDIELPYSSKVTFSEATGYGYNPLEINPDQDYGGVRRAIQKFIASVKKHLSLGIKQEAVMRYILEDLYAAHGFKADDPETWVPDDPRVVRDIMKGGSVNRERRVYLDVASEHLDRFKELLRSRNLSQYSGYDDFDRNPSMQQKRSWWIDRDHYEGDFLMWEPRNLFKTAPTLDDCVRFTERKLKAQFCGTNSAAIALLKDVNLASRGYHRKVSELAKRDAALGEEERAKLMEALDKAKEKASDAYNSYLDAIVSGRELDDLIRYNSQDVLTSVYERFQNLRAIGIYNPIAPPFDPHKPVWQYGIKPLEIPVQAMFVDMVSNRLFERALHRGVQPDVIELIVLDEAKRFTGESNEDIVMKIANEARKFGLGIWVFGQSPDHFPDDLIKATATIIVLGLAEADTKLAARKLGVDDAMLASIVPQRTALIQVKNKVRISADRDH
jgi:DNA helicase HerA-like ATPase